jgi:hypothetical protein
VQRHGQLSVHERRPSQPHCAPTAGERGFVQWKGRGLSEAGMVSVCADGWWGDTPLMGPPGVG